MSLPRCQDEISGDVAAQKPEGGGKFYPFLIYNQVEVDLKSIMSCFVWRALSFRLFSEHQQDNFSASAHSTGRRPLSWIFFPPTTWQFSCFVQIQQRKNQTAGYTQPNRWFHQSAWVFVSNQWHISYHITNHQPKKSQQEHCCYHHDHVESLELWLVNMLLVVAHIPWSWKIENMKNR